MGWSEPGVDHMAAGMCDWDGGQLIEDVQMARIGP